MKTERVAHLTIRRAADMTLEGRRKVATWLRERAKDLLKNGAKYHRVFSSAYDVNETIQGKKWFK